MKSIDLDKTRQTELYADACRHMAEWIPGWEDCFPSDPAVAILEHLSYLSDVQNHHVNRVLPAHYGAYLRLLGGRPRQMVPARMLAMRQASELLAPGTAFCMDGVPFEVVDGPAEPLPQVESAAFREESGRQWLEVGAGWRMPGGSGGTFRIRLGGSLPAEKAVRFRMEIRPEEGRTPPSSSTPAPVKMEAWVGGRKAECRDRTCGLLQSGWIEVTPHAPGAEVLLKSRGLWEGRPVLRSVSLEPFELAQQQTRSACVELRPPFVLPEAWIGNRVLRYFTPAQAGWKRQDYGVKDGCVAGWNGAGPDRIRVVASDPEFACTFPLSGISMERIALEEPGICPSSLAVMVEQNGLWLDCPLTQPRAGQTLPMGCRWDAGKQMLCFGDGRDFLIPEPGQVLICGCRVTRGDAVNGAFGNLTGEAGNLSPLTIASGGVTGETEQQAFLRTVSEQQSLCRAVTCEDYAAVAWKTPGLAMSRIRALPRSALGEAGPGVVLLAKPRSADSRPALTAWQKDRLMEQLDPVRMIGVPVEIRPARYCALRVRVSAVTSEAVAPECLRQAAVAVTDSVEGTLDFGAEVSYTALYTALSSAPHVRMVRRLELIPLSSGVRRSQDGSLRLAPDQLPILQEFEVIDSE